MGWFFVLGFSFISTLVSAAGPGAVMAARDMSWLRAGDSFVPVRSVTLAPGTQSACFRNGRVVEAPEREPRGAENVCCLILEPIAQRAELKKPEFSDLHALVVSDEEHLTSFSITGPMPRGKDPRQYGDFYYAAAHLVPLSSTALPFKGILCLGPAEPGPKDHAPRHLAIENIVKHFTGILELQTDAAAENPGRVQVGE